ncbi:hypothetical protein FQR65_LT11325 [Abscondita terminalis]|nr:hypothetical protein FQR65_LT11325 [Abscondita terminalis]
MKLLRVLTIVLLVAGIENFFQNTYTINHHRIVIAKYNRSLVRHPEIKIALAEDGKSQCINASGTFIIPIENIVLVKAKVYRNVGNTYRIFPFNVTIDGCDSTRRNFLGLKNIFSHTNFKDCPVPKGFLYLKCYVLEEEKFPPHVPMGKYRIDVEVTANGDYMVGSGFWYGAVEPKSKDYD